MNKKTALVISIIVNIILAVVFAVAAIGAADELKFNYVERDTITPDSLRMYIERENYGVAASLSHPIRGGAEPAQEDREYYMLGEYADLLFLEEVFKEAGNNDTAKSCEDRLEKIRTELPDYKNLFDKMELSEKNARRK